MSTATFATQDHGTANLLTALDPRSRILACLFFSVVVVALEGFISLSLALAGSICVMLYARLPAGRTMKKVMAMDGFIIFTLIILPFTTPGEEWFNIAGFSASWEGFYKALQIMLKANAIVLLLLTLISTMKVTTLGHALSRLKLPDNLVHLMLFCVRYIDVLKQEYVRLRIAMKARCFRPANSLHTYRSIGYLLGMLLVRSLERSERIHAAMKCRGFQGKLFLIDDFHYSTKDALFAALFISYVIVLICVEVFHV